jgi:hypothetical protein
MRRKDIKDRISFLHRQNLKPELVDARLSELMNQDEDRHVALGAIKHNKRVDGSSCEENCTDRCKW